MRYKLVRAVWLFFALLVFVCAFTATATVNTVKIKLNGLGLQKTERTFYLHSASSQAERKSAITASELAFVKGESVEYLLVSRADGDELAREILETLGGELLFVENVCGVKSYYAYAPTLYRAVGVKGRKVNLHIAVKTDGIAVGSPLIFGGY